MRPLRKQSPASYQKRWPRKKRLELGKGIPALKTRTFVYSALDDAATGREINRQLEQFKCDANAAFPSGKYTAKTYVRPFDRTVEVVVTQTRAQRMMK